MSLTSKVSTFPKYYLAHLFQLTSQHVDIYNIELSEQLHTAVASSTWIDRPFVGSSYLRNHLRYENFMFKYINQVYTKSNPSLNNH